MTQYILLYILIIHWIADFVLQTHEEATKKSTSLYWLVNHTSKYSVVWLFASCIAFGLMNKLGNVEYYVTNSILFAFITFAAHTITDFFTSKLTKKYFSKGDYHNGFVTVGFDQILHYVQLYLTFKLLL